MELVQMCSSSNVNNTKRDTVRHYSLCANNPWHRDCFRRYTFDKFSSSQKFKMADCAWSNLCFMFGNLRRIIIISRVTDGTCMLLSLSCPLRISKYVSVYTLHCKVAKIAWQTRYFVCSGVRKLRRRSQSSACSTSILSAIHIPSQA
jgi:hypothetical protein